VVDADPRRSRGGGGGRGGPVGAARVLGALSGDKDVLMARLVELLRGLGLAEAAGLLLLQNVIVFAAALVAGSAAPRSSAACMLTERI